MEKAIRGIIALAGNYSEINACLFVTDIPMPSNAEPS